MGYEQLLAGFIETMSATENSAQAVARAFAPVAAEYRIGQLKSKFSVAASFSTRKGENREDILFQADGAVESESAYSVTYHTGENGTVIFSLYRFAGNPAFEEHEQKMLKSFIDVLFIHFGRFRMINAVKQLGLADLLTGLPNTQGFMAYVRELVRTGELPQYNGLFFNLSHFSLVNKRFGVKETDRIIYRYAEELRAFLHDGECVARLGGDNFVALIKKPRTQEFLKVIAGVKTYGTIADQEYTVEVKAIAGVCEIDESFKDGGHIVDDCAVALQTARHIEKKPYVYASEKIKERIYAEKRCVTDFDRGIRQREFKAYYQPKVHTDECRIVGAEALVRWYRDGRIVSPAEFIPVYERNDMICLLDFYMLEQVCMDIRDWLDRGIEPVCISMNFSRKHLSNPNLADEIMKIVEKYNIDTKYIEIELTETVDEEETEKIVSFMKDMKKRNVSMSIDDFGTGYSSLNLLRSFPVDVLKIDKSFIYTQEENDRIVLSNIINMAKELRMRIVAEGVETMEQVEYLKQMNCRVVQGYLFDKPLPREEFERRMIEGKYKL